MYTLTVSFFGHRYIDGDIWDIDEKLRNIIQLLINRSDYVEFLVGADGDFDRIVSSAIKHEQKLLDYPSASHTLFLPYIKTEFTDRHKCMNNFYDNIEICEKSCNAYPKDAFRIRNRDMIDRSDLVIFYVNRTCGGAYNAMKYAAKHGVKIINLGSLKSFENFDIYNNDITYSFEKSDQYDDSEDLSNFFYSC